MPPGFDRASDEAFHRAQVQYDNQTPEDYETEDELEDVEEDEGEE
jgi:hypothetical protein